MSGHSVRRFISLIRFGFLPLIAAWKYRAMRATTSNTRAVTSFHQHRSFGWPEAQHVRLPPPAPTNTSPPAGRPSRTSRQRGSAADRSTSDSCPRPRLGATAVARRSFPAASRTTTDARLCRGDRTTRTGPSRSINSYGSNRQLLTVPPGELPRLRPRPAGSDACSRFVRRNLPNRCHEIQPTRRRSRSP